MLSRNVAKIHQVGYDGRVKNFLKIVFLILGFYFSFAFLVYAQGSPLYLIEVTPKNTSLGTSIIIKTTITISKYPSDYRLHIVRTTGGTTGLNPTVASIYFYMKDASSCRLNPESGKDAIINSSCNKSGQSTEFFVTIDTNKIQVDPNSTQDTQYKVFLASAVGGELRSEGFTIQAPKASSATFSIDSIIPNFAKPGEIVIIILSRTQAGDYQYGILGETLSKTTCGTPTCSLQFRIPGTLASTTNRTATVVVKDASGEKTTSLSLDIPQVTPIDPNQILITSIPTRPPTPTPPPGPCKNNVCITAIGEISTDPAGFVKSIFGIILSLSGGVALLLIIFSGYKLMLSQGNPEKAQEAKETLTAAIVGLLFIIFSLVILQVIGVDILRIPGFQ